MKPCDLILGDCLRELPKLEDNSIDFIFADMPYGTSGCRWDTVIPMEPLWKELERIITPEVLSP